MAAWHCGACQRDLCELCAAKKYVGAGVLPICAACGGIAVPILVPRAQVEPFSFAAALANVGQLLPLAFAVVLAVAQQTVATWGGQGWVLGQFVVIGAFAMMLRRADQGLPLVGVPTYGDIADGWVSLFWRGLPTLGPLALGAALVSHWGQLAIPVASPVAWILVALAIWLVPPALVAAGVDGPHTMMALPWELPRLESRLGGDVGKLRVVVAAWALMQLMVAWMPGVAIDGDMRLMDHELENFGAHVVVAALLAAVASAAGMLLFTHAELLAHGDPTKFRVPLRPRAAPEGTWTPPPDPETEAERAKRLQPIDLEDPREALVAAIGRGDVATALERYRQGDIPALAIDPAQHLAVAQMFSTAGEPQIAAEVLRGIVMRTPKADVAPRALVILARLCAEKLGAPDEAMVVYRRVVEQYPDSDAARYARERLTSAAG
ncbi:MAG: hypothetical protein JST54_04435 [Deltaproteobacteria bacterium]|nr:hypothetical protein [Deltaproteobacteria bacterium]